MRDFDLNVEPVPNQPQYPSYITDANKTYIQHGCYKQCDQQTMLLQHGLARRLVGAIFSCQFDNMV